jgi:hypothetical protein
MKDRTCSLYRRARIGVLVTIAANIVLASSAWSVAAPLPPGTTLSPVPSGPVPGGNAIAGGVPVSFTATSFTGSLTSTVLQNDPTNPLGGLTFIYLLRDSPASSGAIEGLHVSSFAGVMADVDYVPGTGIVPPTFIGRSSGAGSTIDYSFVGPPVGAGQRQPGQGSELVVYTNSHVFAATLALENDGSAVQVNSYATPALPGGFFRCFASPIGYAAGWPDSYPHSATSRPGFGTT